jgi:isopentenyl-diphosphate delta-isomerase
MSPRGRRASPDPGTPPSGSPPDIPRRKAEHMEIVAARDISAPEGPGWSDVRLLHHALPVVDFGDVDLGTDFLGRRLQAPLLIAGMTGGHEAAQEINAILGRVAERHGLAMGVGSQRAALRDPSLAETYAVVRRVAPRAFLVANLGAAQLVPQESGPPLTPAQLLEAVAMIRADALAIHLNFLEELIQPEGDRRASGLRDALAHAVAAVPVPVIAKETGAGLSQAAALELRRLGVRALDVGGMGGTSFAAVEAIRAHARGDARGTALGRVFQAWGIPTAVSVVAAARAGLPVIATGGVRTGLDAAKALALGATLVGVGRPLLQAALRGEAAVDRWVGQFLEELRAAVFLCGLSRVADLPKAPRVVLGETRQWLEALGLAP